LGKRGLYLINRAQPTAIAVPHTPEQERQAHAAFASQYSEEEYCQRLAEFYQIWDGFNRSYFQGALLRPHLAIGRTAPRSLGHCSRSTDYGGAVQITLNAGLVFGTNTDWVVRVWPTAAGTGRFIHDLVFRFIVRQFVLEQLNDDESNYHGFGPKFVTEANRVGAAMALPPVVAHRSRRGDKQIAGGWPHCVRPADYYGDDVTERLLELACYRGTREMQKAGSPSEGLLELQAYLVRMGRVDDIGRLVEGQLRWLAEARQSRWPLRQRVEEGKADVDGTPLGEVACSGDWLRWNGGTVLRLAQSIAALRYFADLPLLAVALEEAGCDDERILRHLRARAQHSSSCWVLARLLALVSEGPSVEKKTSSA
jgi:hypothetical protein